MRGIEGGELTADYQKVVGPYRAILHGLSQQTDGTGLYLTLAHDFGHFSRDFRIAIGGSSLAEVFDKRLKDVRPVLVQALSFADIKNSFTEGPPKDTDRRIRYDRGVDIAPFMQTYLEPLFDSMDYLEALASSNAEEEERSLIALSSRRVPLQPICPYYFSRLMVEGVESTDPEITLDGLRFIIFYNILTNASQHSLSAGKPGHFEYPTNIVDYQKQSGRTVVTNDSPYTFVPDLKSRQAIDNGQYGLFIANLYADLAGVDLQFGWEQSGTFLDSDEGMEHKLWEQRKVTKPKYKISVSMG